LYSIASSLKQHPDGVHLTVAAVRYQSHGRKRKGVGSTFLADRIGEERTIPVYIDRNNNFKLPADPATPIIMIGPGTGIASFRAFLEEREAVSTSGKNWLFFGDQHFKTDFFYQTTRKSYQLNGIVKRDLKKTIAEINGALLNTIAACGDVNRNVMCNPNPYQSRPHAEVYEYARRINEHLTPRTTVHHEIWLDEELLSSSRQDEEPIYGKHYLPRKFKIAVAIPPSNDVDIFANDLGFIAIAEDDRLSGLNVTVGGGLSMTHGEAETYPRLADVLGYCPKNKTLQVAEEIVKI
jgi:hypothetical protein